MIRDTGYTVWFAPKDNDLKKRLTKCISTLTQRRESVAFHPHVTLLSLPDASLYEAKRVMKELQIDHTTIQLSFGNSIETRGTYFQCLFVPIISSISLVVARQQSLAITRIEESKFMPHLSLLYDELSQSDFEILSQEIIELFNTEKLFGSKQIFTLELWHTEGYADEWYRIN